MAQAGALVAPQVAVQRDVWPVLHRCAQVQGRLDREAAARPARRAAVERQAAAALAQRTAAAGRCLTQALRRALEVVVLDTRGLRTLAQRQAELAAKLARKAGGAAPPPPPRGPGGQLLRTHLSPAPAPPPA